MASHGSIFGWVAEPKDIDVEATRSHTQLHRCGDGRILHRYSRSRREWVSPRMGCFFSRNNSRNFPGKSDQMTNITWQYTSRWGHLHGEGKEKATLESAWNWPKGIWIRIFVGLKKLWSLNSPICLETFLSVFVWNQKTQTPEQNIPPKVMRFFSDRIGMISNCKIVKLKQKKHIYFSWPICQDIFSAIFFFVGFGKWGHRKSLPGT